MTLSSIPWALVIFRLAAGPALTAMAVLMGPSAAVPGAVILALGVLSDIFDGIIARRLKVATERLRRFDSRADVVFWVSTTIAVHLMYPALIAATWPLIAILTVMEAGNHALSFARFGREASPHHLLSKLFGLGLWALFTQLILTGQPGWLMWAVVALGMASQIEACAITLRLKAWRCDVPSVFSLGQQNL
ncbi:MAG: CDP-alcohol phosphatidyltransferase family protein [Caulobacter sp.]